MIFNAKNKSHLYVALKNINNPNNVRVNVTISEAVSVISLAVVLDCFNYNTINYVVVMAAVIVTVTVV